MIEIDVDNSRWNSGREAMQFVARHDGKRINCYVSREALVDFASVRDDVELAMAAFSDNKHLIADAVTGRIERGEFDASGEVIIRLHDLERAGRKP